MGWFSNDAGKPYLIRFYVPYLTDINRESAENVEAVLAEKIPGQYKLEIVEILHKPKIAKADGIFSTPALKRIRPEPQLLKVGSCRSLEKAREKLAFLDQEPGAGVPEGK